MSLSWAIREGGNAALLLNEVDDDDDWVSAVGIAVSEES